MKTKRLCRCTCTVCGTVELAGGTGGRFRCHACRTAGRHVKKPYDPVGQNEAISAVNRAVKYGKIQPATAFACVDCGKPAQCYDHRDYSKPLDVEPVCRSCNHKRGPAAPHTGVLASSRQFVEVLA